MRLSLALSRYLDVPLVPHFMDDWVDNLFTHGQLGGYARSEAERVFAQVLQRAPVCLTIGEDMRREFESRLNRPCVTVGNSVDLDDYRLAGHCSGAFGLPNWSCATWVASTSDETRFCQSWPRSWTGRASVTVSGRSSCSSRTMTEAERGGWPTDSVRWSTGGIWPPRRSPARW